MIVANGEIEKLAKFLLKEFGDDPAFAVTEDEPNGKSAADVAIKILTRLKRETSDKMSASEGIYGFSAWLTGRTEALTAGAKYDVVPVVDAVREFCEHNGLDGPREGWEVNLKHPPLGDTDESGLTVEKIDGLLHDLSSPDVEKLNAAESVFGVVCWLAGQKNELKLGNDNDPLPVLLAAKDFCVVNGLCDVGVDWVVKLKQPLSEEHKALLDKILGEHGDFSASASVMKFAQLFSLLTDERKQEAIADNAVMFEIAATWLRENGLPTPSAAFGEFEQSNA